MLYAYRCRSCNHTRDSQSNTDIQPCGCGGVSKRDYTSVQLRGTTAFQPHFNYAVGKYVSTEHEFKSALRRSADANTIATGVEHKYEMVDPGDLRRMEPTEGTEAIEQAGRDTARFYAGQPITTPRPDALGNLPVPANA